MSISTGTGEINLSALTDNILMKLQRVPGIQHSIVIKIGSE